MSGLTGTTDSSGNWSVSVSSSQMQGLDSSSTPAVGETITVTATATGSDERGRVRLCMIAVLPNAVAERVSDGFVNASEDDGGVAVVVPAGGGHDRGMTIKVSDGTDSLSRTGVRTGSYREKVSNAMSALSLESNGWFGY